MATSTPTPPDPSPASAPRQQALGTVREQVAALDELVALARHSIRVFDRDLSEMGWNAPARAEKLATFLRASRTAKLEVIVHANAAGDELSIFAVGTCSITRLEM